MSYDLKKLSNRHHEIARMSALGCSAEEISESLNIKVSSVRQMMSGSSLLRARTQELSDQRDASVTSIRQDFEKMAPVAINSLEILAANEDGSVSPAVQLSAARYILSVLGAVPVKQVKHQVITAALPQEDVKNLLEQLKNNQNRACLPHFQNENK